MGGIAGILHFEGSPAREQGERLSQAVALRGPDQQGFFSEGPVYLAQRRNRVAPGGKVQPIRSERYVLAFDGRLYDHVDLARSMPGPRALGPRVPGDAEVLLRAWEAWGPDCLLHLDGAFALAVWDRDEEALYLARDPLGLRPLHYAASASRFAVASLASALLRLPWVSREISTAKLCEYLAFRYVHAPGSLLRQVQAVAPGCLLRMDRHGMRIQRFARPQLGGGELPSHRDLLRELERLLRRAVARRCRTGVPIGLMLSGGLDSSVIARYAVRSGFDVRSYHLAFRDTGHDEAAFAGRVAQLLGTRHTQVDMDGRDFEDALGGCLRAMGSPLPDPAAVCQYILLREARRGLRVVLSGDGGDELLAGGSVMAVARLARRTTTLGRLAGRARSWAERGLRGGPAPDQALRPRSLGFQRLAGGTEVFDAQARKRLLRRDVDPRPWLREEVLSPLYNGLQADAINTVLGVYQQGWLPEDTLARSERMGSACGVEVRYPLLDRSVVALLNQLPGDWKLRTRLGLPRPKWPMRALLARHLPRSIIRRPKRNFPSPLHHWLRHAGAGFLRRRMERLEADRWGLWRPEPVRALARAHLEGQNKGGALWLLIMLDAWLEEVNESR